MALVGRPFEGTLRKLASLVFATWLLGAALFAKPARAASDPSLVWSTIETPHFRIHYHSGIEEVAQHVANVAESIHENMVHHVGWRPKNFTEILLIDSTEVANGSATALPYNALRLFVTAPEDLSPLGDVDDWYLELVTHEYTHILHTDQIRGIPAILNGILGKTFAPNQAQPRWILEGLAVHQESARTSGGRVRDSQWDMWLRTDVLENNVASLDQVSNYARRWPQGNLWYLYGSYFTTWISETYGEEVLRKAAADYGSQIIPWGFNRSMRRASGATYVDMYPAWIDALKKKYGAQAAEVRAKGLREGTRLTHHGQFAAYPRWIPKGAWPEHQGSLFYYREDADKRAGMWALPIQRDDKGNVTKVDEAHSDQIARTNGGGYATFDPEGGVVLGSQEYYKNVFLYGDLERMAPGEKSPFGTPDGKRTVLTHSLRAADPAVSPDGRHVVFVVNRAGTRSIHIGDLTPDDVVNVRPLVDTAFLEQAFTPRWSPDGTHVAYSVWKRGGCRDIRYVNLSSGTYEDIMVDRAIDGGPSFSADGRFLFFHSDRTGISNVYAWEIATRKFFQVTNVLTGAYQPEPSPDGKTLAYVGYTKDGFDLFAMPLDASRFSPAPSYVDERPVAPQVPNRRWASKPYNPWPTLMPRRYGIQLTPGNFGDAVVMSALGSDIAGFHSVAATMTTEISKPELQGSLSYSYGRLPFDVGVSIARSITPRKGYGAGDFKPTVIQENVGVSTAISFSRPRAYDGQSFSISHTVSRIGVDLPIPREALNPYDTPQLPVGGLASYVHFGYAYSNAERYLRSVGAERGYSVSASLDVTDPSLGSDFSGFVSSGNFSAYYTMPWLKHHSLAIHGGGGTSGGTFPGRGAFFVGGFVDTAIVDTLQNQLSQGGIVLRGYEPVALSGRNYLLGNLEYRFPIVNIDRGLSTLPIFLNRLNGNVFLDYGSAFDVFTDAKFKTGTGLELWSDWTLGYIASFTFRLGYARGLASTGIDKFYFVAAIPY